jgi:hypothetical protein
MNKFKILCIFFFIQTLAAKGEHLNILDYGAIPNDTIDDTQYIMKAIGSAKEKDTILFPEGTFIVNTIKLEKATSIILSKGSVLHKKKNSHGSIFLIYSSNVSITGKGILDGNRENVVGSGGILVAANAGNLSNMLIDGITIRNTKGLGGCGINLEDVSNVRIANTIIEDIFLIPIFVRAVDYNVSNIQILNNTIDRSREGLGLDQGGIQVRGTKDHTMNNVIITGNKVWMPVGKVKTAGSGLCIEAFQNVNNVTVTNNFTKGGSMGVSFCATTNSICSNNTIISPYYYGIEQAVHSSDNIIKGNSINGEGLTQLGIQGNSGSYKITFTSNKIEGVVLRGIQVDSCTKFTINKNDISLTAANSYGIDIVKSQDGLVTENLLKGNYKAGKALMANASIQIKILENNIMNWTDNNGLHIYCTRPIIIDHILYKGNKAQGKNKGIKTQLSNGAALGKDIISIGNQ